MADLVFDHKMFVLHDRNIIRKISLFNHLRIMRFRTKFTHTLLLYQLIIIVKSVCACVCMRESAVIIFW